MHNATISFEHPGYIRVQAELTIHSAAEAAIVEQVVEEILTSQHGGAELKFEDGAVKFQFWAKTDAHVQADAAKAMAQQPPAQVLAQNAVPDEGGPPDRDVSPVPFGGPQLGTTPTETANLSAEAVEVTAAQAQIKQAAPQPAVSGSDGAN